eukprot:5457802-Pyramimonas_sp.AAC.1
METTSALACKFGQRLSESTVPYQGCGRRTGESTFFNQGRGWRSRESNIQCSGDSSLPNRL